MTYDLGGFSVTQSTVTTILAVFCVYSVLIVGIGFWIKYQEKKQNAGGLAGFLTGGGGLGAFAIAMIAATNSMAGGTMIAAPGLGYKVGFSAALIYYAGFLTAAFSLGAIGRKMAILRARTGAVSFLRVLRLRFQSKSVIGALALTGAVGLTGFAAGQITAGAKVFAAITGTNIYLFGLFLTIIVTVIYTMSGGVKSMAKIAIIQGIVMLIATFAIVGILLYKNITNAGSLSAALQKLAAEQPKVMQANNAFSFLNALGIALFAGIGLGAIPHSVSVTLTYNDHAKLRRSIIISCAVFTLVQGIMCGTGPLLRALVPGIKVADYTTIYTATNLLPAWVGGLIVCGVFAAIQSSIAGVLLAAAAGLAKDFIVDCYNPQMDSKKQNTVNTWVILALSVIATVIAWKPTELTQYLINFSLGAICSSWYWAVTTGLHWKKASRTGVLWSIIVGFAAYIGFYFMSILPATKPFWVGTLKNVHPFIPAWLCSFICMYFISKATLKKDQIKLGYFQVFFCDDYDEEYAKL